MALAQRRFVPQAESVTHVIEDESSIDSQPRAARLRAAADSVLVLARAGRVRLPMLPESATEAMRLAADPNVAMMRLEAVITRDPMLATRMLSVASSPAYAGTPLRSLNAALQRLGTGAIRDLLYQSVMECHMFRGEGERAARAERDHAIAVARVAKVVCKLVGIDQEYAFLCGLLHDIGRMALAALDEHMDDLDCTDGERHGLLEIVHTQLGAILAAQWKLPALASEAVRRHHKYRGFGPQHDGYSQIGHVVAVADSVVSHLGIGRRARALDTDDLEAIHGLGCDPANLVPIASAAVK